MTILAALNHYYDRLGATGAVPVYGYSNEKISFAILLSIKGDVVDIQDLRSAEKTKRYPQILSVPQSQKRPGGLVPFFLWDNTAYVLGVAKKIDRRIHLKHAAFKAFHQQKLTNTDDAGLQALLSFLHRWDPDRYTELRYADEMMDTNIVFSLDEGHGLLHDRGAAQAIWIKHIGDTSSAVQQGRCLVTGEFTTIARLHPAIKGVYGAQTAGGAIVSFNLDAFCSYGKKQGANAPVSETAAFGYTAALNKLLERGSRNRLQIADTSTVFWADTGNGGEEAAQAGEDLFATLINPESPTDEQEAAKIRDPLEMIAAGRPLQEINPKLNEKTRFYVLGLAPNAARISIRFWQSDSLGSFVHHFSQHWQDLKIEPCPWRTAPSVRRLLFQTAVQGKAENIPPLLGGELMRAVLTGGRYPRSLLTAIIVRMRADREINGMRAAIVKACLTRDCRNNHEPEDISVSLNKDDLNPAYRLGRLFAVLENAQRTALGKNINATIRDRYYAAASATPAAVFPVLLRTAGHHISSLRKGDKGGFAYMFDKEIGEIMDGLEPQMPRNLRIEDQGRFAIGYYHQKYARKGDSQETTDTTEDQDQ